MASSNGVAVLACALAVAGLVGAALGNDGRYRVANLVSDGSALAVTVDPHLVNPWGVAFNPTGYAWVADADSGYSTLYDGRGVVQALVVAIPDELGVLGQGHPTGIVFNAGSGFEVEPGQSAKFIFVTENGTVAAWAPGVASDRALTMVNASAQGAVFKGLAIALGTPAGDVIYAADFANGVVRAYDTGFDAAALAGTFTDPALPNGYSPFGIQTIGKTVYVAYALREQGGDEEVAGPGLGIVDAFDTSGNFVRRVVNKGGELNAPWGIALAPEDFGAFSGDLLVGNFGDGRINAFDPQSGEFEGALLNPGGTPIEIEGLWGIAFGNGVNYQPKNALFYAAGIHDEAGGLYGSISPGGCYADFDLNGSLELFDFLAYVNAFNAQDPRADCTGGGELDLFDFLCFVNAFNEGC